MADSCQGMGCSCARCLMLWIFPASWPRTSKSTPSFWTLFELVITLSTATNRKMHEPAHPKGEFILRMQGCFMHFKGWEAARLQRLELQITGLSLRFLRCFSWVSFFSLSLWNIFFYRIHMANKQLNRQIKYQTKGNKHDSQQSVPYVASNEGGRFTHFNLQLYGRRLLFRQACIMTTVPAPHNVNADATSVIMCKGRRSSYKRGQKPIGAHCCFVPVQTVSQKKLWKCVLIEI